MANSSSFGFSSLFLAIIFSFSLIFLTEAQKTGVTLDLVHRDSERSPFYNPNETPYQRIVKTLHRSISRANHVNRYFSSNIRPNTPVSDIYNNRGEYLMNISIGTPPFEILAIADTGSDLIWTQCQPCTQCYRQVAPIFNPNSSSTYEDIACSSSQCQTLEQTSCSLGDNKCLYVMGYGDRSFSKGNLAVDTLTLGSTDGSPLSLPKSLFGCGHNNAGSFDSKATGIIGLGGGALSLVSQLGSSVGGKFSYCLVPLQPVSDIFPQKNSSKINFGTNGVVSGSGVVSTPIIPKQPDTFYYLTLEGISVRDKRIEFDSGRATSSSLISSSEEGNIIIDSGTTLTLLPLDLQTQLVDELTSQIQASPVPDPTKFLDLCYAYDPGFTAPTVTVHFKGADVELKPVNTFVRINDRTICLTFKGNNGLSIYGNLAQTNFLVGYDSDAKTVSFKPTDCTRE